MAPSGGGTSLRIAGIPVQMPWSSLIGVGLLAWLFAPGFSDSDQPGLRGYGAAAVFAVLVYASILVHELAHAAAARAFGFPVHEIQLNVLGGYTTYERKVHTPGRELAIALAGPGATLALAAAFWACAHGAATALPAGSIVTDMLVQLARVGLLLGIYNLLPGIPLDGGSLVKCPVWKVSGSEAVGTRVAAISGLIIAVVVFALPFIFAYRLDQQAPALTDIVVSAMIAGWLAMGAFDALRRSTVEARLPSLGAATLARRAIGVDRDMPLSEALRRLGHGEAGGLVVLDSTGTPIAIAHEAAIAAVPEVRRPWVTIASVSRTLDAGSVLSVDLAGQDLLEAVSGHPAPEYLVVDDTGMIYGVLTMTDLQAALTGPRPRG